MSLIDEPESSMVMLSAELSIIVLKIASTYSLSVSFFRSWLFFKHVFSRI